MSDDIATPTTSRALSACAEELERVKAERPTRFELDHAKSRARDAEDRLDKALSALRRIGADNELPIYVRDACHVAITEIEGEA